jgi:DNA-binding MarR family transcriptional regulator
MYYGFCIEWLKDNPKHLYEMSPKETEQFNETYNGNNHIRHDLQILQSLRRIIRAVDIHSRQLKQRYNITAPQLVCLLAVVENEVLTVATLAKEIHLSSSTVVGILDRLEEKGLVERNRDKKDRRVVKVTATKVGKEFTHSSPSPLQDKLGDSLGKLSVLEQSTIALSLKRIVEFMEAEEIDAAPILQTGGIEDSAEK